MLLTALLLHTSVPLSTISLMCKMKHPKYKNKHQMQNTKQNTTNTKEKEMTMQGQLGELVRHVLHFKNTNANTEVQIPMTNTNMAAGGD